MQLSEIGKIAYSEWFRTMEMRPDMNLQLGEFVVMPNHIHGIIIIGKNETNHTETNHSNSITPNPQYQNQFAPQSKNLSSIIRGYKSAVTTSARKNQIEFNWQTRFHEHIIRSTESFERISEYIVNNPIKWKEDRFNPFEGSPK
jgi:REP element-mobilizing transposase RayT